MRISKRELEQAWFSLLSEFEWHHGATLTPRYARSEHALRVEFETQFIRRVENKAQRPVGWFLAIEESPSGRLHIHSLLQGTEDLTTVQIEWAWNAGFSDVSPLRCAEAAISYALKEIKLVPEDCDLSRHLIRRENAFAPSTSLEADRELRPTYARAR